MRSDISYFINSLKKRFPYVSGARVEAVVEDSRQDLLPSRCRTLLKRTVVARLKAVIR